MGQQRDKRIECKNGTLIIPFHDDGFQRKMLIFKKKILGIVKKALREIRAAERRGESEPDASKHWERLAKEFNWLFGPDACQIVFGTDLISAEMLTEFFDKLDPYIDEWSSELLEEQRAKQHFRK